jgi:hypothetical protein
MTATIKAAISPFAQAKTEFDSNPMHFLNEGLASVPASGIPEEFRTLGLEAGIIAEHLLNNKLQMSAFGATEGLVTLTKQMKIGPCEQVRVN